MKNLTLVIPAKNEEDSLSKVLLEIKSYNLKKILVVNQLNKKIIEIAKKNNCKIFKQSGSGYGNAVIEGLNMCSTKYACIFNADGSFDPKYLSVMFKEIKKGYKFIFASRYEKHGGSKDDTIITLIGNKIFSFMGNFLFKLKISDILFTYILGETKSFKNLKLKSEDFRLCPEIPIKSKIGEYKYKTVPSLERKRFAGKKNVNELIDGFLILCYLIKNFLILKYKKKRNFNSIS